MFQPIFQKFRYIYQQLKVTFFSPRPFISLSGLMKYQAINFTRQILRLEARQSDLKQRSPSAWEIFKQALPWTATKWIAILSGCCVYTDYLSTLSRTFSLTFGMAHFETVVCLTSFSLLLNEYLWWTQLNPFLGSRPQNDALWLLYAYANPTSKVGLTKIQETKLVGTFNRQQTIVALYCGLTLFTTFLHLPSFLWFSLSSASSSSFLQIIVNIALGLNYSLQSLALFLSLVFGSSQAFLLLTLFKIKLKNCSVWLSLHHFESFSGVYFKLNHEITQYNTFLREFMLIVDLMLKLGGTFLIIFFTDSGFLTSNVFAFTIAVFIGASYAALNGCFCLFAVFPQANLTAYKRVSRLYVQTHLRARFQDAGSKQARTWARVRAQTSKVNVRQALSTNGLLQFLASRQFGFTYGQLFFIDKKSVLENVLATIIYFLLFIKRRI